ncbi:heterodimeric geranylgeranyl pyrophosphate synthase small subunit, chloroplastic-like [Telopea speciosissima]|uniref:heterodimeric geranylgeranyl pyrophosphate synthase small subunit, chloroplastic-like n=1 Tax=Telopea speciosissima TaxID=54955 RepID=UPI001CC68893|nr:heterodimeric geranylgeranyl pyrophosphate synthase small subunit, chloroplastic-like [Telopea speciosissima]XP_043691019.1 heterodimeric geranylgeranyl pyrophosphate synthase small subunit, chloroplastic-like [Telopea speciosissima]
MEGFAAPLRQITTSPSTGDPNRSFPQYRYQNKPMKVAMPHNSNLPSYWASISADIEDHLKQSVPVRPPLSVYEPMNYLVFSAPRTMAPALSIAACELVGGQPEKAIPAASVLHLMYAASTVHQRLLQSGRAKSPTTNYTVDHHNNTFPAGVELLTGDGIFSFGYELLARPFQDNKPERILRVIMEITHAMGAQGMVEGQYLQLCRSGSESDYDMASDGKVGWSIEKMEGGLYACGAACGAILGGATKEETERLRSFGRYVGIIHGMITSMDDSDDGEHEKKEGLSEVLEKLRSLALKELECFDHQRMVEIISSILHLDSLLQFTHKQTQSLS